MNIYKRLKKWFAQSSAEILLVIVSAGIIAVANSLPYLNLFTNWLGLTTFAMIVIVVFSINGKLILQIAASAFFISGFLFLLEIEFVAEQLTFLAFNLIYIGAIRLTIDQWRNN